MMLAMKSWCCGDHAAS